MSTRMSSFKRYAHDHFEPQDDTDPAAQRRLRGLLEQIDYTAFASNREVIAATLGHVDAAQFQRMAVACAHARAHWVAEALTVSEAPVALDPRKAQRLADLRTAFEELSEAYEALRRMVERGYLSYRA